ncbi:CPBP family intramembrane metalloprotease [Streptomyces sp. WZ.A104]|uniref:CPBP family intramembrane glutamic endopeptidase n=1 Tax=Streptomyces sp. WZ.A104 TaxID=2023771 RepID=UPI000BBC01F4|nr:CPBP family intramembrane glutamic endopeptidase [Streptomyces sp. WZ.A104]PCG81903.1 CPBP family intramembrane metalloprotease [Streptomyces sp. WZ.A104]
MRRAVDEAEENVTGHSSPGNGSTRPTAGPAGRILPKAAVFLTVAFVAAGVLGALQPTTRIPAEVIQLTQFGPAFAVAVVALRRPGWARSLPAVRAAKDSRGRVLLLATPPLIIALCAAAYGAITGDVGFTGPGSLPYPFVLIAAAQLLGACAEELGWRCFLQPLLRTRYSPLLASVIVGLAWGVWHVQVLAQHPAYAGGFLLGTVSMSVVLGIALDRERGMGPARLLLAGGFHALINLGMLLFMDEESGAVLPMVLFGAACLVAAVLWGTRRRLRSTGPTTAFVDPAGSHAISPSR